MKITNFEFKARVVNPDIFEKQLLSLNPAFMGEDHQTDTYFNINSGRLKLREGNIENALIHYERQNCSGAKQSDVLLYRHNPDKTLKDILVKTLGIKIVVEKDRRIYYIGNVKFHFDRVNGLGTFIEVEAIDDTGQIDVEILKKQCLEYADFFGLSDSDYVDRSYSDILTDIDRLQ